MEIFFELSGLDRRLYEVPEGPSATISLLRVKVCEVFGLHSDMQEQLELELHGTPLGADVVTLEEAGVTEGCVLNAVVPFKLVAEQELRQRGATISQVGLFEAVAAGHVEELKLFAHMGLFDLRPALVHAVRLKVTTSIKVLINKDGAEGTHPPADPNTSDAAEYPIVVAANNNEVKIVELLLELGAVPDTPGLTALTAASRRGFEDVTRLLVEAGAHVSGHCPPFGDTFRGVTPLYYWASKQNPLMCAFMMEAGADASVPHDNGESCLTAACRDAATLKVLLTASPGLLQNERLVKYTKEPALLQSARAGCADAVALLLAHGATVTDDIREQANPSVAELLK